MALAIRFLNKRRKYMVRKAKEEIITTLDYLYPNTYEYMDKVTWIDTLERRIEEEIIKISYFAEPEKQKDATEQFLDEFAGADCQITVSGNSWVDFVAKGTGKGEALEKLGRRFGIRAEEMAAFGDNENDRTILS